MRLIWVVVILGLLLSKEAYGQTWSVTVQHPYNGGANVTGLKSKAQVDQVIRANHPAASLLKPRAYTNSGAHVSIAMRGDDKSPDIGQWTYKPEPYPSSCSGYPCGYVSEAEALESLRLYVQDRRHACDEVTITSVGPYDANRTYSNGATQEQIHETVLGLVTFHVPLAGETGCTQEMTDSLYLHRGRTYQCDQYFSAEQPHSSTPARCVLMGNAVIQAPIANCDTSTCEEDQGNPINIISGSKKYSTYDLQIDGIELKRTYNSSQAESPGSITNSWTDSFSGFISTYLYIDINGKAHRMVGLANGYRSQDPSIFATQLPDNTWKIQTANRYTEYFGTNGKLASRVYPDGRTFQVNRNPDGTIATIVSGTGRTLTYSYNSDLRPERIDGPDGSHVEYSYDINGMLLDAIRSDGSSEHYFYDDPSLPSLLTKVEDGNGATLASYTYGSDGRALTTSVDGVNEFSVTYNDGASTVAVEDPLGLTKTYQLVTSVGSTVIGSETYTDPNTGQPRTTTWLREPSSTANINRITTGNDRIDLQWMLTRGLITSRTFKHSGQVQKSIETDWHATFPLKLETRYLDAIGNVVRTQRATYNARNQQLTSATIASFPGVSRFTTWTYCEQADVLANVCPIIGLPIAVDGPRTDVVDKTTYTYYPSDDVSCTSSPTTCPRRKGDLWKVTDALGRVTETLAYDGAGRVLSVKDANNVVTDFTYHPRGWLITRKVRGTNNTSEADDQITSIEYWPTGLIKKVTQPDGAFTAYTYDAAHRLTDIADNAGNTIHYTLDNAGNRTTEETKDAGNVLRRSLSRVYNQLGQLQTAKDAYNHATGFTYDADGNNQTVTDALGHITDNDYDPLDRLVRTLQDVGGIAAEMKFEYDGANNLTKVTDPRGLDTIYTYNPLGDLTQLNSPDTGTTSYTYDSAGNRKTQTDARSITATYSYDALNRLTGIAYPTSSLNVTYAYDTVNAACLTGETFAIGRLTKMTDGSGNTEYCYDRFGNLTRKRQTTNGITFTVRYAYTPAGQTQAITYPDGSVVDYVRDGQGRATEVGVTPSGGTRQILLHQATYYPFGPVAGWTYGNSRTMSRTLNQNYQPLAIQDPSAGGLSLGYEFDEVGNLKKLFNADQSVTRAQYAYDALNRLTDVKDGPTGTVIDHYAYDATGNRISFTNASGTTNYTYSTTNHRLTQVGATLRTYDNAGNTTQIAGTAKEFVYNDANRMSQVKVGGMPTMNYQLSGRGEQVRKYLNTTNTYTVYDEAGQWVGDYDSTGAVIQQAIWLDGLPVGLLAGATTSQKLHYLEPDHLGTARAVIDRTANTVIWRWDLEGEAFGNTVPNQDPDGNGIAFVMNMRFPGQRYDNASGLNYNYFRSYDPSTGRYSQSDPIGLRGGMSSYSYASQSPNLYIDWFGLLVYRVNGVIYRPMFTGQTTILYPGGPSGNPVGSNINGRTILEWSIKAKCLCEGGSFRLDEFEIDITPVVYMRNSYPASGPPIEWVTAKEGEHVGDFTAWATGFQGTAQAAEDGAKKGTFSTQQECENLSVTYLRTQMMRGAQGAANASHATYDLSGQHNWYP